MAYRVLRLLEYTYTDAEIAEADMEGWQTPANGTITFGSNKKMRSVVIQHFVKDEDDEH